jgi:hypothetical protein
MVRAVQKTVSATDAAALDCGGKLKDSRTDLNLFPFLFFSYKLLRRNRSEKTRDRGKNADAREKPGTSQGG